MHKVCCLNVVFLRLKTSNSVLFQSSTSIFYNKHDSLNGSYFSLHSDVNALGC